MFLVRRRLCSRSVIGPRKRLMFTLIVRRLMFVVRWWCRLRGLRFTVFRLLMLLRVRFCGLLWLMMNMLRCLMRFGVGRTRKLRRRLRVMRIRRRLKVGCLVWVRRYIRCRISRVCSWCFWLRSCWLLFVVLCWKLLLCCNLLLSGGIIDVLCDTCSRVVVGSCVGGGCYGSGSHC